MKERKWKMIAVFLGSIMVGGAVYGETAISVNFTDGGTTDLSKSETAGVVAVSNWESIGKGNIPVDGADFSGLRDNSGTKTTVTYASGSTGGWWSGSDRSGFGNNDADMLVNWSDSSNATLTFDNVNSFASKYDVYIYSWAADLNRAGKFTVNGQTFHIATGAYSGPHAQSTATDAITAWEQRGTKSYVKFTDVTLDTLVINVEADTSAGGEPWLAFNGIQIVQVEAPSTTPAVGVEVVQTETELTWIIEEEISVAKYLVVDVATGEVIETVIADGSASYKTTVSDDVTVKLIVVDNSGFNQTFLPVDGSIVKVAYDLTEGWNLIAMPGDNADTSEINSAFWGWNGESYEKVETPAVGNAVWVYSTVAKQVVVSAEKATTELILEAGWNMVGPTENMAIPAEVHTVYGWTDTYQNIATEDGVLLQGVGYWIFVL